MANDDEFNAEMIKKRQEERLNAEREAERQRRDDAHKQAMEQEIVRAQDIVAKLAEQYPVVVKKVSEKTPLRAVVVLQVTQGRKEIDDLVDSLMTDIKAKKFRVTLESLSNFPPQTGECEVGYGQRGANRAWYPSKVPAIGSNGTVKYLVVSW